METMTDDILRLLIRELKSFKKEIEIFPEDNLLWETVPGITNAAGNLTLHICGNLKHFIGAVLGNSGYVRNRDSEFSTRSGSREDLIREIEETIEIISDVLPRLSRETIDAKYPQIVGGIEFRCGLFLLHLCTHLAHHLGQAGYLRRVITRDNQSSEPVSLQGIANT
jgi:uncharacterized damage-inducible protein DinB